MSELQVARGSEVFTCQSAALVANTGTAARMAFGRNNWTLQTVVGGTGAFSVVSVKLQGSLDGVNWFDLAASTSTAGDATFGVDKPAAWFRVNAITLTVGSGAPTLTAYVVAV